MATVQAPVKSQNQAANARRGWKLGTWLDLGEFGIWSLGLYMRHLLELAHQVFRLIESVVGV